MNSTDNLFPDERDLSVRAGLTALPESVFPLGEEKDPLLNQLVPGWSEKAEIVAVDFRSENISKLERRSSKPLLFISGSVASPIADGHSVSIKVDTARCTILYKDPYGNRAPASVAKWINAEFPGFTYRECPMPQQRDDISCRWISLANIVSGLEGKDIDPHIQRNLDDFKSRVLQAARAIWPDIRHASGMERCADPIEFHCFQHLKAREEKPTARLVLRKEDLPAAPAEPEAPKTFILHGTPSPSLTRFQAFFQRINAMDRFKQFSKT